MNIVGKRGLKLGVKSSGKNINHAYTPRLCLKYADVYKSFGCFKYNHRYFFSIYILKKIAGISGVYRPTLDPHCNFFARGHSLVQFFGNLY